MLRKRFCHRVIRCPDCRHLTGREPESRLVPPARQHGKFLPLAQALSDAMNELVICFRFPGGSMSSASYSADPPALTCWKDIAHYFGKGVRTVQRWEREFGLPVRRPQGTLHNSVKSPVVASPRDLDAWLKSRWALRAAKEDRETGDAGGGTGPVESLEACIRQSHELRHKIKAVQEEHHKVVRDLTLTVSSLRQTCQNLTGTRKPFTES
jgi:hypothetical protein